MIYTLLIYSFGGKYMQESIRPRKCIVVMFIILLFFELWVFPIAMCKDVNTAQSSKIHSNLPINTTRTFYTPFQNSIREFANKSQLINYTDYLLKNKQEIDNLRNQKIHNSFQYMLNVNRSNCDVIYVPDDYLTIQSAVENTSDYDEIIVRNGTYIEYVIIERPLFIHSEHGINNCIVKPKIENKPAFDIISDNVTLSGFNICNGPNERYIGIALNYAEYCVITNNYLHNLNYEIWLHYCNHTILDNNILGVFGQVQYDGIRIENSINITVTNNIWYDHIWEGLYFIHTINSTC